MTKFKVLILLSTILHNVISTSDCAAKNALTASQYEESELLNVVANSSKLELNHTNITDYLGFSRIIDIENITLPEITSVNEPVDRYFIAGRRRTCLENVTKCLAEGK